uniref:Secreted protein n=1 Tax=Arundo donax TaxID=35708 RepID=A0A0A9CXS9_ARUDO
MRKVYAQFFGSALPALLFSLRLASSLPPLPPSSPLLCGSLLPTCLRACPARELVFFLSWPAFRGRFHQMLQSEFLFNSLEPVYQIHELKCSFLSRRRWKCQ